MRRLPPVAGVSRTDHKQNFAETDGFGHDSRISEGEPNPSNRLDTNWALCTTMATCEETHDNSVDTMFHFLSLKKE